MGNHKISVALFSVIFAIALSAQDKDKLDKPAERHMAGNAAAPLCAQSAFAHGFMHGYENGFRRGDGDYQMGRSIQDLRTLAEFKDSAAGYHSEFGNKNQFRRGYGEGFLSGYSDSVSNRSFRAFGAAKIAAAGIEPAPESRREFDEGFASGYESLRPSAPTHQDRKKPDCTLATVPASAPGAAYCEGFRRGRQFAFFAAPIEQPQSGVQTAAKR